MRNRAIDAVHQKDVTKAKIILDSCYAANNLDTMVIALLHETLLMHINRQQQPHKNLKDINAWESQYPFLKEDQRLQKIKVQDAVHLGMLAFDNKELHNAAHFTTVISKIINESSHPTALKKIPNVDALFYNTAMQLFYDKKFKQAYTLFARGKELYPQDKNMDTMYRLSKERLKTKK